MTSSGHVIWAWADIIFDYDSKGLSVSEIRGKLREEDSLHVGEKAIRDVLKTKPEDWFVRT